MASPRSAAVIVLATVAVLAGGLFAVSGLIRDRSDPAAAPRPVATYTVETATLGSTRTAAGRMEWKPTELLAPGLDSGTLTSTSLEPARPASEGEVLFTIDLQPVVAIESTVPFFRDLGVGARGADVEALLGFLERQGHLASAAAQRGTYTPRVTAAVDAWQVSLGQPKTGVVTRRSLLAVSGLPALLATTVPIGTAISGEAIASRWLPNASFEVTIGGDLRAELEDGAPATVHVDERTYPAKVGRLSVEDAEEGAIASEAVVATLVRADGGAGPVCGEECTIPAEGTTTVTSVDLVLLAPVDGPVVPASAIGTDASGATYVVDASGGRRLPVTIVAEADGRASVTGVEAGTRIAALVPA